jgi:hypothetical protein
LPLQVTVPIYGIVLPLYTLRRSKSAVCAKCPSAQPDENEQAPGPRPQAPGLDGKTLLDVKDCHRVRDGSVSSPDRARAETCLLGASPGRVELGGRALLPPGIDDIVLSIFDDEPTSIVAYFLSNRCKLVLATQLHWVAEGIVLLYVCTPQH